MSKITAAVFVNCSPYSWTLAKWSRCMFLVTLKVAIISQNFSLICFLPMLLSFNFRPRQRMSGYVWSSIDPSQMWCSNWMSLLETQQLLFLLCLRVHVSSVLPPRLLFKPFYKFTFQSRRIWLEGKLVQNTYVQFEQLLKCFIFLKIAHGYAGKNALQIGRTQINRPKPWGLKIRSLSTLRKSNYLELK